MSKAVVTRYEMKTEYPLREPITVAHVSDLHSHRAEDILALLRAEEPDIIVVTGDTLERYDNRPQYDFYRKPVKRLIINMIHYANYLLCKFRRDENKAHTKYAFDFMTGAAEIAPVYMSLGNHEQKLYDSDRRFYAEHGITLLDNEAVKVKVRGFDMNIGGMSSWDFEEFLDEFAAREGFKLLLCHHPERFEPFIKDTAVDLTLSGHTHGGQVRIGKKGRGFFVPGQGLLGKYARGRFFGGRLIVSSGCSNTVAMPRWLNPRELVIIDLKGKDNGEV